MTDKSLAAVQEMVAPIALELALDVESVEIRKTGNQKIVKVILDKDGGISLEEIAAATREISVKLDELAELASSFTLEVTSPGVDRPLTAPKHWRRNLGRLVRVELISGGSLDGRITVVTEEQITLQVKQQQRMISLTEIKRAVVQVEFNRPSEVSDGH